MNIDSMKVAIRPMSTPQALDLGMVMARHWFIPLWKIWVGMALPVYVLFYLGGMLLDLQFEITAGAFGSLVFWWLKPLYEKPMITWLGEALFIDPPPVKNSVASGWRQLRDYMPTLLIKKRLSLQRQLILPILMLEQPDSPQFKSRLQILSRGQGGGLGWHTIVMVHIEMIIAIGTLLILWQMVPTGFMKAETLFTYIEQAPIWAEILWSIIYFLAVSLIAPFFVSGGFAVYLTKRCLLEGWDVELVFKQLRLRYEQEQANPLTQLTAAKPTKLSGSNGLPIASANSPSSIINHHTDDNKVSNGLSPNLLNTASTLTTATGENQS